MTSGRRLDLQDKAVKFYVVTAPTCHSEVLREGTALKIEPVLGSSIIHIEVEYATICTPKRHRCVAIPVKELRQIIDLRFYRGKGLDGIVDRRTLYQKLRRCWNRTRHYRSPLIERRKCQVRRSGLRTCLSARRRREARQTPLGWCAYRPDRNDLGVRQL